MSKVEIQGDVGQVFAGDIGQVHIHYPPAVRGWGLVILLGLEFFAATGWLILIFKGVV
ncbi:hypothetical protein [Thiothrix lacustris]|uniref:hypothetical protein n=1 Tax=Thiothrix lacustris TaxID=525917 RepID=UPI000AB5097D|nr:hypothetical protein [Thiothrix lacustris]